MPPVAVVYHSALAPGTNPVAVSGEGGVFAQTSIGNAVGAGGAAVMVTGSNILGLSHPKAVA